MSIRFVEILADNLSHQTKGIHPLMPILKLIVILGFCQTMTLAGTRIEVTPLSGEPTQGELVSLNETSAVVKVEEKEVTLPLEDLLQIDLLRPEEVAAEQNEPTVSVALADGSQLTATQISIAGRDFSLESPHAGKLTGPAAQVESLRFQPLSKSNQDQWSRFLERESKKDLLVINKGESIDFVEGIVAGVDEKSVQFLLDGEQIAVDRLKVFGVIYSRESENSSPTGQLLLKGGDRLSFSTVKLNEGTLVGTTGAAIGFQIEFDNLRSLDLRQGRLVYLSELDPRVEDYTTFFDEPVSFIKMRRDTNFDNGPIRINNRSYKRGVCLHSRTLLRFRIAGDYRRFQAVMGIEDLVGSGTSSEAHVEVTIKADDRVLFSGEVKGGDSPRMLDFDVAGARDLEIFVDYGQNLSIQDHLALADARLVK